MLSLTVNYFFGGYGVAARISEISFTKNSESEIYIKNPNLTKKKKKKKIMAGGRVGGGVWLG